MKKRYPKFKAAAVQAAPVFLNLEGTVNKTCDLIAEAARNGAKLVAFPEAFIPGYPWWIWMGDPCVYGQKFFERLYENAVEIPGEAVRRISGCAREHEIYVCVSVSELEGGTLYLAQLWFDPKGNLIGKHRKLKPSSSERIIWGDGDGSTIQVFETEIGRLGGLMCWEHIVPLSLAAMTSLSEQVHVSAWPCFLPVPGALMATETCELLARYYPIATQTYALMTTQIYTQEMMDMIAENDFQRSFMAIGGGATAIYGPNGLALTKKIPPDAEGIVYAELDLSLLVGCKYLADPAGHYSVPSALSLNFNRSPQPVTRKIGPLVNGGLDYQSLQGGDCE
jgi:cyanide dihydratase